jgi:hypothetical protein
MVIFIKQITSCLAEFYMNFKIIYADVCLLSCFSKGSENGEANIQTRHSYADRGSHVSYRVFTRKNVHGVCIKISRLKGRIALTSYCNFRSLQLTCIVTTQLTIANFYSCFYKVSTQTASMFRVYKTARNCVKFCCQNPRFP